MPPASSTLALPLLRPSSIVALGASAGGLEALVQFLGQSERLPGAAFVVLQHMSAGQPSLLASLLQRATALPVMTAEEGQAVEADKVFVSPPGRVLRVIDGHFRIGAPGDGPGERLPIDALFTSLATGAACPVVGVVLSGMGSDGTLGLQAIKAAGGATFVQSPDTAQFDSMPRSALAASAADSAAAPFDLPTSIGHHLAALSAAGGADAMPVDEEQALSTILAVLRQYTGHEFGAYKKSTIRRCVERRALLHHQTHIAGYAALVAKNRAEAELLFKDMLIGVTAFFRDPAVWEHLRDVALPELLANRPRRSTLRVWVAGCSTGEEVYSLAMTLAEALDALEPAARPDFKIFATDIDSNAIERARLARYSGSIASAVSADRLARFFVSDDAGFQVAKGLRETIVFALQNVAMDPPFTKLDLLVCRNLLIYFEPLLQQKLMALFHFSLEPGGLLVLGTAETTGPATDLFAPLAGRHKFYRRLESFRNAGFMAFPATFDRAIASRPAAHAVGAIESAALHRVADQFLLQHYAPAAVLVGAEGDVLYISGKTGRYLEPAAGRANWNIFAMAREGLSRPLAAAFALAMREQMRINVPQVIVQGESGPLPLRLTVEPISAPRPLAGMVMVVFAEIEADAPQHSGDADTTGIDAVEGSSKELRTLQEAVRAAREDAQGAQEQFRAVQEELQSTNEELQSTNEELTTSKEEMQSMNEELQTVNQELRAKVDALSQSSDDMRNLLNSTEIATLFLDEALRIRRYTPAAVSIFKLIAGDVGRPITDITNALKDWDMAGDAAEVLGSLMFREREIAATDARWFKVRVMPYRTSGNRIDGVVITLSDISESKRLERELTRAKGVLERKLNRGASDVPEASAAPPAPRRKRAAPR